MESIRTTAIVKNGRIIVPVPAKDGTNFEVVLVPRRRPEEVTELVNELDAFRIEHGLPYVDAETLKAWEEKGFRKLAG